MDYIHYVNVLCGGLRMIQLYMQCEYNDFIICIAVNKIKDIMFCLFMH